MIGRQAARDHMRCDLVTHTHIQVKALGTDVDESIEEFQPHLQTRVAFGQCPQRRRYLLPPETEAAAYTQRPANLCRRATNLLYELVNIVKDALRPAVNPFAFFRQCYTARRAVKEPCSQCFFEHPHPLADIGGRCSEFVGRGNEAGLAHNQAEHAQVFQVRRTIAHVLCMISSQYKAL